jgi:excisionase family DNA binding protein
MSETQTQLQEERRPDRKPRLPGSSARLVTIAQGSMVSGVPGTTIRDLIARGHLPVVRFPGSRRIWIRRADLEALIERSVEVAG